MNLQSEKKMRRKNGKTNKQKQRNPWGSTHTHTHTHTGSVSGYLRYKKIIENIKTHVLYIYFGIPKYV